MLRVLGKIGCILTIITLLDGFSIVFQTIAWTTMLVERIPIQGLYSAVDSTFSGEHPCKKCTSLQDAQKEKEERDQHIAWAGEKYNLFAFLPNVVYRIHIAPDRLKRYTHCHFTVLPPPSILERVPTPPPDFV